VQMGILAILAMFAADAGGAGGAAFAITYAAFLAVTTWLWYTVRLQDTIERPEFTADTGRWVTAMAVSVAIMAATAFAPAGARVTVWALLVVAWVALFTAMGRVRNGLAAGITPTESLVERFGTFTIIVLGEVVFGVVTGLSASEHDVRTISTGLIALTVGFGFWWIYFDLVGGRLPRREGPALANWILGHLPVALSIAAAGAGMVSLLTNAHAERTPAPTAWLLSGAVALGLVALILTMRALVDAVRLGPAYRSIEIAMAAGAVAGLAVGFIRPAPWLLALLLVLLLGFVWSVAVRAFLLAGAWTGEEAAVR
jgi:low temperature requirement protein LtrA